MQVSKKSWHYRIFKDTSFYARNPYQLPDACTYIRAVSGELLIKAIDVLFRLLCWVIGVIFFAFLLGVTNALFSVLGLLPGDIYLSVPSLPVFDNGAWAWYMSHHPGIESRDASVLFLVQPWMLIVGVVLFSGVVLGIWLTGKALKFLWWCFKFLLSLPYRFGLKPVVRWWDNFTSLNGDLTVSQALYQRFRNKTCVKVTLKD